MKVMLPDPVPAPCPPFRPGVYKDPDGDLWLCPSEDRSSWVCIRVTGLSRSLSNAEIQKSINPFSRSDVYFVSSTITLSF